MLDRGKFFNIFSLLKNIGEYIVTHVVNLLGVTILIQHHILLSVVRHVHYSVHIGYDLHDLLQFGLDKLDFDHYFGLAVRRSRFSRFGDESAKHILLDFRASSLKRLLSIFRNHSLGRLGFLQPLHAFFRNSYLPKIHVLHLLYVVYIIITFYPNYVNFTNYFETLVIAKPSPTSRISVSKFGFSVTSLIYSLKCLTAVLCLCLL